MKLHHSLCLSFLLVACTPLATPSPTPSGPQALTVMTHDSFAISEAALQEFESTHNAQVTFLKAGDVGTALNQAILAQGNPVADVLYGVDNTFLSRALAENIFEPYAAPGLAQVPDALELDAEHRALPVDYGDVCLNYDIAWFSAHGLTPPATFDDLLQPNYRGRLVVENPAVSSPGLAFLLATIAHYGPDKYLEFWQALRANDVKVVNDWETAYYTDFSASAGKGAYPMVVSYASSPPAEVIFADPPLDTAPTASVVAAGMCFRQIEFVGILRGTPRRTLAEQWVDFMLAETFQADLPLQMFVFPARENTPLPTAFTQWAQIPAQPATLPAADIAANREAWLQAWTEAVLK